MEEVFIAREADIDEGARKVFEVGDLQVGIFKLDGELHAWHNHCPHQGGPVCQGKLMKGVEERLDEERKSLGIHYRNGAMNIVCPWHGWEFDIRTGRHAGPSSVHLVPCKLIRRDGEIYVSVK